MTVRSSTSDASMKLSFSTRSLMQRRTNRLVGHRPNMVALGTETFKHKRGMIIVGDHRRAPVFWLVHPAEDNVLVLDVEPGIGGNLFFFQDEIDGDQISKHQRARSICRRGSQAGSSIRTSRPRGIVDTTSLACTLCFCPSRKYITSILPGS